jgi:hypothetical protein
VRFDAPKVDPAGVAPLALDGVETDLTEILADDVSRSVKQGLSARQARPAVAVARRRSDSSLTHCRAHTTGWNHIGALTQHLYEGRS